MFNLTGKTALVTGAASGIGEAIAHCLAAAGAMVYVADRDAGNGERVAAAVQKSGHRAAFMELDVAQEHECVGAAQRIERDHGSVSILVNNAGIGHVGTLPQ